MTSKNNIINEILQLKNNITDCYNQLSIMNSKVNSLEFIIDFDNIMLDDKESIDFRLTKLSNILYRFINVREFFLCEKFLEIISIYEYDINILIGIITHFHHIDININNYNQFFLNVKDRIYSEYSLEEAKSILKGYE